jgi:hypothetical protein
MEKADLQGEHLHSQCKGSWITETEEYPRRDRQTEKEKKRARKQEMG